MCLQAVCFESSLRQLATHTIGDFMNIIKAIAAALSIAVSIFFLGKRSAKKQAEAQVTSQQLGDLAKSQDVTQDLNKLSPDEQKQKLSDDYSK